MHRSNKLSIRHESLNSVGLSPYSQHEAPDASVEVPRLIKPKPALKSGQSARQPPPVPQDTTTS